MDLQRRAALLARTDLFGAVDEATRRQVAACASERVVAKGEVLFLQDEPGDRLFILAEGVVKLYVSTRSGGSVELIRHDPPAAFGEVALLDGGPRSASAQAVQRSTLLVITRADLIGLLRSQEQVAEALLRSLGAMVRRTTSQLVELALLDLQGRVASKLLQLAGWAGPTGLAARVKPVTQEDLAAMVGGARQTVNRALRSLAARGCIRVDGRAIELVDPVELQRLADQ